MSSALPRMACPAVSLGRPEQSGYGTRKSLFRTDALIVTTLKSKTKRALGDGDTLAVWCGWLLLCAAILIPLLAWLWPRGFWIAPALVGLLGWPAAKLRVEDRPVAIILCAGLVWAAASAIWSPYHPTKPGNSTLLKLTLELPLYGSALLAARRADPRLRRRALSVLAWGCGLFGALLLIEGLTHGALYKALRVIYGPMRPDLAEAKIGHSTYLLAVLWPLAAAGAHPRARPWLAASMVSGAGAAALAFGADAPVLGLVLAVLAGLTVWRWPNLVPKLIAAAAVALFLGMPLMVWAVRHFFDYAALEAALPKTDAIRMSYWSHAIDFIRMRPLRGWGLDASRVFGPAIRLHPHNDPLQVWMELGAVGALLAAAFWGVILRRLSHRTPSLTASAAAASAAVYLLFGVNFGVWQEWWLALGAVAAMIAVSNTPDPATSNEPRA
jgi:O-antigen ligase